MNALSDLQIELRAGKGGRVVSARELPLSIGGAGADIEVPGADRDAVFAMLGVDEHGLYVEPRDTQARLNGQPLAESSRLTHGDVLGVGDGLVFFLLDGPRPRLQVEEAKQALTVPPVIEDEPTETDFADEADAQSIQKAAFRPMLRAQTKDRRGDPRRWIIAAIVALFAAILWFLTTSNSVLVISEPKDAKVNLTGGFVLGFGGHYLLRSGTYTLTAAREGYEPLTRKVQVASKAPNQQVRVALKKLPGIVRVEAGGVTGTLAVDGAPLGAIPGEYRLPAGSHEFTVTAPRYAELKQTVEVEGLGKSQRVVLKLVPGFSPVTIESKPAGARVAVDDKELGITPLTTEIDAGSHTLALMAQGFRRWESSIQVKPNEPQTIGPVELGLPDGRVTIQTKPAGADVTVSGRYRGRSPIEISLAPGMQHSIDVVRSGYESDSRSVPVKAGERATVNIELKPILGDVTVRGQPADAQLFVDGENRGSANQTLKLPSTELKVEIKREGYVTFATTVTPQPGVARTVDYQLLTPAQAKAARTPTIVTTKVDGQLRLMPTGNFEMGSTRRDAGARSNESQRAVVLQRAFYLGVKEVTNEQYLRFQPEHMSGIVKNRSLDQDNHPVVNIGWRQAAEFCNWLSQQEGLPPAYEQKGDRLELASPVTIGYRLPTEAEWEWGARHQPGQTGLRVYQWGQGVPVPRNTGNYADKSSLLVLEYGLQGYEDGFVTTAPVGAFKPNSLGLFDMDGNVTEWVNDYYTVYRELDKTPATDPTGPPADSGDAHVIRGANWRSTDFKDLRLAWRDSFAGQAQHIGFRIARYAE